MKPKSYLRDWFVARFLVTRHWLKVNVFNRAKPPSRSQVWSLTHAQDDRVASGINYSGMIDDQAALSKRVGEPGGVPQSEVEYLQAKGLNERIVAVAIELRRMNERGDAYRRWFLTAIWTWTVLIAIQLVCKAVGL